MITTPPSPVPPWHRPVVSPTSETLSTDGAISLATLTTYLNQTAPSDPEDELVPYVAVLPDGNYNQQTKDIIIPATAVENTALWRVNGNFVGFIALLFDDVRQSVSLKWDGAGWHFIGGNAGKTDS